ncbi:MAG TPA: MaoC family dehydratase N-terminal domain-containing protein [Burkholderiales bacterium]
MATPIDIEHLRTWIGKTEVHHDTLPPTPAAALAAALDREDSPGPGDALPPLWHWIYFLLPLRQSQLGVDGHPKRGGFLPPVPLPRRMWAGGRFEFHRPLYLGAPATRVSRIADVAYKEGRSGPLVFVQVRHEISDDAGLAIAEDQDIVYREAPRPGEPAAVPKQAPSEFAWRREIRPDPVLLFRYSALTFNGHRIHYDHPYATQVEGYPGLVVHGPLIATLLVDLLRRNVTDAVVSRFSFRAVSPLFDTGPFHIYGKPAGDGKTVRLWAGARDGRLAMEASAELAAAA